MPVARWSMALRRGDVTVEHAPGPLSDPCPGIMIGLSKLYCGALGDAKSCLDGVYDAV
jgi:hypothetical protein